MALPLMVFTGLIWTISAKGQGLARAASALGVFLQLSGPPVAASAGVLSDHEMEEINAMAPQDQAIRLLERAINHYAGAREEIARRSEGWIGQIHSTPQLEDMTNTAYFSSDLRVRAAALEIWLARDQLRKSPETVDELIRAAAVAPGDKKWFLLSSLGILGGRGIEPEKVFDTLFLALHDPDAAIRGSAINGMGLLGAENTIAPLLEVFHSDPSADLRERAACNLADSGMLSRELRQKAVPELVRFSQDPSLDAMTRKWVFQALREITQQKIGDDPSRWVSWYGSQPSRQ